MVPTLVLLCLQCFLNLFVVVVGVFQFQRFLLAGFQRLLGVLQCILQFVGLEVEPRKIVLRLTGGIYISGGLFAVPKFALRHAR